MPGSTPFRLNRSGVMLAMISAGFAGEAGAAAGRVEFAVGGATVSGADGRAKPLAKGSELDSGDTIRTNDGRAQIRFTDGSYVSLQPDTEFGIKDYKFEEKSDGSERGFFALAKGAMRTVTGLIGRSNRNAYQISTPTATIGIRGTGGVIQVLNDGSTLVTGTSGIWSLTNPSGSVDIPAGVSGLAPSKPDSPPQQTSQAPSTAPAPVQTQQTQFSQGDQKTSDGKPADIPTTSPVVPPDVIPPPVIPPPVIPPPVVPLTSGSGYALAMAVNDSNSIPSTLVTGGVTATLNSTGQLTAATLPVSDPSQMTLQPAGSNAQFGTDGILAWGRWIGPATYTCVECATPVNFGANQGLHYVIGMPTPVMPASGTATYTLLGATSPTYANGLTAPGTFGGTLNVTFGTSALVGVDFNVAMPNGRAYHMTGTAATPNSLFSTSLSITPTGIPSCSISCTGSVAGFFAGANAARAGVSYRVTDSDTGSSNPILGAAAFKKQ